MADTVMLEEFFDRGFQRDRGREQLDRGVAWTYKDYIPHLGAPARQRGGYLWGSADIDSIDTDFWSFETLIWAPFFNSSGSPTYILVGMALEPVLDKMHTISIAADGAVADIGTPWDHNSAWINDFGSPFFFNNQAIFPLGVLTGPRRVEGAPLGQAVLGGSPPFANYGGAWGSYAVLVHGSIGGTIFRRRAWWSGPNNGALWTTGTSFWDFPRELTGYAPMSHNLQIFFGISEAYALIGDIPPPGGNFQMKTLHDEGCFDDRSIVRYKDYVIWANSNGVFRSDGTNLLDLTKAAGISQWYREQVEGFDVQAGWHATSGIFGDNLLLSVSKRTGELTADNKMGLGIELDTMAAYEFTNINANQYASRPEMIGISTVLGVTPGERLFVAPRNKSRVIDVASFFDPDSSSGADADGTRIEPVLETRFYILASGRERRVRWLHLGYQLEDLFLDNPAIVVSITTDIREENPTYTLLPMSYGEKTTFSRERIPVRMKVRGFALKILRDNNSSNHSIHSLEVEGNELEGSR